MMNKEYIIKSIGADAVEKSGALDLVWRVFLQFEAPEYTPQGAAEFKEYIEPKFVKRKIREGTLTCWGSFDGDKIVGFIAVRPPCHVSLFFVDADYHRQGIGRALYDTLLLHCKQSEEPLEVTVNASPYALKIYKRLGFAPTDDEKTVNGIRFIPMKHTVV
ncbi:MAG: GNAT family N-acetyltransferase [Eubacteriales bacterium]